MDRYKIYAGGKFLETEDIIKVYNPYNGEVVGETFTSGIEEYEFAVNSAIGVQQELKNLPSYMKYEILMQIAGELAKERDHFTRILCLESAKPWKYASGEIARAIQTFTVAAEESKRLPKEYISLDWTEAGKDKEGLVKYFPVGPVAAISPFNFPMNLAVHKIAPAIAAGCPIILKPSSSTPLSTLELAKVISSTKLPAGSVSVLPMDRNFGNRMVGDERFKLLSFTGSPAVGWKMKQDAGKKKILLELGGNAGVIVTETADIEFAVDRCVMGAFAYSGQVCIHTQRIFVSKKVFNSFLTKFVDKVKQLKMGDPMDETTAISAMIDRKNATRVEEWIGEAVDAGAEILLGGKRKGSMVEPTLISQTKSDMKVCDLEVFGPVVVLEVYEDFNKALGWINEGRFGLQAGVFTNNIDEMDRAFDQLETGAVIVNDVPTFRLDHMPYGGVKDSGLGREGLSYAIREMMESKLLIKNS